MFEIVESIYLTICVIGGVGVSAITAYALIASIVIKLFKKD